MEPKTPEKIRSQSRAYYRENALAKNRHDLARRTLQREGLLVYHDDLRNRIEAGEVDAEVFLERDVFSNRQ